MYAYLYAAVIVIVALLTLLVVHLVRGSVERDNFDPNQTPFQQLAISKHEHRMLLSIMRRVDNLFETHHIPYFLIGGSLMGSLRYENRMPWDDDIDLGVLKSDAEGFMNLPFSAYNLVVRPSFFGYQIYDTKVRFPYVDVFLFTREGDRYVLDSKKARTKWPRDYFLFSELYPLSTCLYDDLMLPCPAKSREFLNRSYPGWDKTAYVTQTHHHASVYRTYKLPINAKTTQQVQSYLDML